MTNREFFETIANSNLADEVKAFAQESIAKLDARNEKRKTTPSKVSVANEPIKVAILEFIADKPVAIASDIGVALEISTSKASALCRQLVEEGKLVSTEVKAKKGKVKGYSIPAIPVSTDGEE